MMCQSKVAIYNAFTKIFNLEKYILTFFFINLPTSINTDFKFSEHWSTSIQFFLVGHESV